MTAPDASNPALRAPEPALGAPKPALRSRLLGGAAKLISPRLDKGVGRIRQLMLALGLAYFGVAAKLAHLGFSHEPPQTLKAAADLAAAGARPDLLDRNGAILATDVKTMSVFAEPRNIIDKDEAVELITAVLPDVNARELRERLNSKKGFIWIKRHVTSKERNEIFHLGLPGIGFWPENERVYPNGPLAAHVLGFVDKDNIGIAGMEKYLDKQGLTDPHVPGFAIDPAALKPVRLSLDLKATHVLRDELMAGMDRFKAKAAAGAILDVDTGEVIALESLPDFDPNDPPDFTKPENRDRINRINVGTYEMGSTFKALTLAMGLDSGKFTLGSKLDARESLRSGHFTIHDFEPKHRFLSFPEVFTFSSNIGTARIAMAMGIAAHQAFLRKLGQLTRLQTELPESAAPQVPKHWGLLNTMTIAFGQGLNVAPLQALMGVAALLNGGHLMKPTFLVRDEATAMANSEQVVSAQTSESMRYLMRSNATHGSARKANIEGYYVGGKTGTAQKIVNHRYSKDKVFTTFMAVVPADKPKYLYMAIYDQPQSVPGDGGFHTAAYNAGRTTGALIERIEPLEGVPPMLAPPTNPFPIIARLGYGADADRTKE